MEDVKKEQRQEMLEPLLLSHNRTSHKLMLQVGVFFLSDCWFGDV